MASYYYDDDETLERDTGNDNPGGLPTYGYLDEQERTNPNSRFGRWQGWVEKRAAERYADISPEEREARRHRGWGPALDTDLAPPTTQHNLRPSPRNGGSALPPPPQVTSVRLGLAHLSVHEFGSRFVPHSTLPIQALLPLPSTHYLLMGDSEGLAMLDIIPEDGPISAEANIAYVHALEAAKRRRLWSGEGVHQFAVLENGFDQNGIPQGVVLATVAVEGEGQEHETIKSIRMYNLASLTRLAAHFATQTDTRTLELSRPKDWSPQESKRALRKTHKRGVKSLLASDATQGSLAAPPFPINSPRSPNRSPNPFAVPLPRAPPRHQDSTSSTDSSWDMVDDLPLRWATDYVPLATSNSRLASSSVLFFELWKNYSSGGRGTAMLAIATKTNILLYETPKGERAFKFIKEFYTPQQARSISFVHQAAVDDGRNSQPPVLDITKRYRGVEFSDALGRSKSLAVAPVAHARPRRVSSPGDQTYGPQLSLFVVFEKKAGLIRIADSAVDEIDMYDDGMLPPGLPIAEKSPSLRRSFQALDPFGFGADRKGGAWLPLCNLEVPTGAFTEDGMPLARPIVLISRGRQTHIHPSPIPVPLAWSSPLRSIWWNHTPNQVTGRVCYGSDGRPFLQVLAYGDGVEVAELDFSFLAPRAGPSGKGKGKAAPVEPLVRAYTPAFDHSRFACRGGEWHLLNVAHGRPELRRSMLSVDGLNTREWVARAKMEEGFYGWYMKDVDDYRVFWMGNIRKEEDRMPDLSRLSVQGH